MAHCKKYGIDLSTVSAVVDLEENSPEHSCNAWFMQSTVLESEYHFAPKMHHSARLADPAVRNLLLALIKQIQFDQIPARNCRSVSQVDKAVRELGLGKLAELQTLLLSYDLISQEDGYAGKFYDGVELTRAHEFYRFLEIIFFNYAEREGFAPASHSNSVQAIADAEIALARLRELLPSALSPVRAVRKLNSDSELQLSVISPASKAVAAA